MHDSKRQLSDHLRETLTEKFSSVSQASVLLGIPYERLKKAIRENRFNAADLAVLMPDRTAASLSAEYSYTEYSGRTSSSEVQRRSKVVPNAQLLNQIFTPFLKKAVVETEFHDFVNNIYESLTSDNSMFLFCSNTFLPIEWDLKDKDVLDRIYNAVVAGGAVIYIFEDAIGDEFELFTKALERLRIRSGTGTVEAGFVARLRVDRCSFCTPHQKLALLNLTEDNGAVSQQALTALEIPEFNSSPVKLGVLVLPLVPEVASSMWKYLNRLVNSMEEGNLPATFELDCFPAMTDKQFVERMLEII